MAGVGDATLTFVSGKRLRKAQERSEGRLKGPYMGAYLHAALEANAEILKEAGLAAKWRSQGLKRGLEKGGLAGGEKMLSKRSPLELIEESAGLSAERIRRLQQQQDALRARGATPSSPFYI
ncbi:MAG: hypothetical protein LBD58_03050 [Treponema sp.]|jgi:hypothetical protein|nr:hypothetical protein [Treponema sp.]